MTRTASGVHAIRPFGRPAVRAVLRFGRTRPARSQDAPATPTPAAHAADKVALLRALHGCMHSPAFTLDTTTADRHACLAFVDAAVPACAVRGAAVGPADLFAVAFSFFAARTGPGDFRHVRHRALRAALNRHLARARGR